jgi:Ca2+-binding RTX toxin-like protein
MAAIYGNDLANDLSGTDAADSIYGLGGDDTVRGGSGDKLYGGIGDDVYFYNVGASFVYKGQNIIESYNEGRDLLNLTMSATVEGMVDLYLPDNLEDLNLNGVGHPAIVAGNDLDNTLKMDFVSNASWNGYGVGINGMGGDDVIYGSMYSDEINGGPGDDGMVGGKGDDVYYVDSRNDIVIEYKDEGCDVICTGIDKYHLPMNVERLEVSGVGLNFYGNSGDNDIYSYDDFSRIINAGAGNDQVVIYGSAADLILGGAGNDTLQAGLGDDVYRTSLDFGHDTISDTGGLDSVEFDVNPDQLWFAKSGNDLNVSVIGTQNIVTIKNYYSDASAKVEEFDAGNGKVLAGANVDTLVSAMAMFAPPTTSTMPQSTHDALAWTLSSTWQ